MKGVGNRVCVLGLDECVWGYLQGYIFGGKVIWVCICGWVCWESIHAGLGRSKVWVGTWIGVWGSLGV